MMIRAGARIAFSCFVILLIGGVTASAQVQINVTSAEPEIVWRYSHPGAPCTNDGVANDYADVPARPFLVNGTTAGTYRVLWFAANSKGYFASETAGPDVAPAEITLAHFKRRPHCPRWVHSKSYKGSLPDRYNTGLWMVTPFTTDGLTILPSVSVPIENPTSPAAVAAPRPSCRR